MKPDRPARKDIMTTAPEFSKGQTIKLTEELEVELENGYLHILPVGTEVTVTEAFPDADYWTKFGVVNMDISYAADVHIHNPNDISGQSDTDEYAEGVMNIDYSPTA